MCCVATLTVVVCFPPLTAASFFPPLLLSAQPRSPLSLWGGCALVSTVCNECNVGTFKQMSRALWGGCAVKYVIKLSQVCVFVYVCVYKCRHVCACFLDKPSLNLSFSSSSNLNRSSSSFNLAASNSASRCRLSLSRS